MALTKCKECGQQISQAAAACPHCGSPHAVAKASKNIGCLPTLVILGFAAVVMVPILGRIMPSAPTPQRSVHGGGTAAPAGTPEEIARRFVETGGAWEVVRSSDSITGKAEIQLQLTAANFGRTKHGLPIKADLTIRCKANKTDVFLRVDDFINNDPIPVTWRVDEAAAKTATWSISTDYQAVFPPQAIAFTKSLLGKEKLVVRFTPYAESPQDFTFVVAGLDAKLPELRKLCNW